MHITVTTELHSVAATEWNALVAEQDPFLAHEFLVALERHQCLHEHSGWWPQHLLARDAHGRLVGACPLYLKDNSYGELVFDWNWATAYERYRNRPYYPKLVSAIPFTPATGARLLLADPNDHATAQALLERTRELALQRRCSSVHWLFPNADELAHYQTLNGLTRLGCQFHWHNQGYRDFADFLERFTAKKRKNIRQERRKVQDSGIELRSFNGLEVSEAQWVQFHRFYCSTFYRLGGQPTLTLAFFLEIAHTLGERVRLTMAYKGTQAVAAALCFRSANTLYGRHWGCNAEYDALHFEACYYQGIEYCIAQGLTRFEPGAQGEHKVSRGFIPTFTYSAHWLADAPFHQSIAHYLQHETPAVHAYAAELRQHLPYRDET